MRNPYDLIREKEERMEALRYELWALHTTAALCEEPGDRDEEVEKLIQKLGPAEEAPNAAEHPGTSDQGS